MVTVAFQVVDVPLTELRSRSPMWNVGAGVFVGEAVAADVAVKVGRGVAVAGMVVEVGSGVAVAGTDVKVGKAVGDAGMVVLVGRMVGDAGMVVFVGRAVNVGMDVVVGNGALASH